MVYLKARSTIGAQKKAHRHRGTLCGGARERRGEGVRGGAGGGGGTDMVAPVRRQEKKKGGSNDVPWCGRHLGACTTVVLSNIHQFPRGSLHAHRQHSLGGAEFGKNTIHATADSTKSSWAMPTLGAAHDPLLFAKKLQHPAPVGWSSSSALFRGRG